MQVAIMAQAVANGGVARRPVLLQQMSDVLSQPVGQDPSGFLGDGEDGSRVGSPAALARLVEAMKVVVLHEEGTGRRAQIDGLSLALKTGTAGNRAEGLDAIMIGLAPAESPAFAIGLMASHAGKAEYEGARIVKAFFEGAMARGLVPGHEPQPIEGTSPAGE